MKIAEIISFVPPKKIYDNPVDYVYAYHHRFDNMWSRPSKDDKSKKKHRKSKSKTQLALIQIMYSKNNTKLKKLF